MANDTAFLLHYFNHRNFSPQRDAIWPILPSLATFRAQNPDLPVHVIDCNGDKVNDWGPYPEILNFRVERMKIRHNNVMVNRPSYIHEFAENSSYRFFIHSDVDILWHKPLLPLEITGFHGRKDNNGLFYWDRESAQAIRFWDQWLSTINRCTPDSSFREVVNKFVNDDFTCESIYKWLDHHDSTLIDYTDHVNNCIESSLIPFSKNVHLVWKIWTKFRGKEAFRDPYKAMIFKTLGRDLATRLMEPFRFY